MELPAIIGYIVLVITIINASVANAITADQQREASLKHSAKILRDLYITFRNIAFPKSPLSSGTAYNRFVLMSPGKVLNYWDYYPGEDYEVSLLRKNTSAPESFVPPAVMEKWFDIADVMVGADPFSGGTTGKSMATVYETITSQMQLLGIDTKSHEAQSRYNMAKNFLTASVVDPDDMSKNTTRLSLYDRFHDLYTQRQLDMEERIDSVRRTRSSIEYELWFQRNYPALHSKVEGAYIRWLVFGEKEMVELYKAYMDTASAGAELYDARIALRASGVQSLDRTRTIYPVSFEPSNWYKYLLPKIKGPSRDILLARKSMFQSERDALQSIIAFSNTNRDQANETLTILKEKLRNLTTRRDNKTSTAVTEWNNCIDEKSRQPPPGSNRSTNTPPPKNSTSPKNNSCNKFRRANQEAVDATFQQAQVNSEYMSAAFLLNSKDQFNSFLNTRITSLNRSIQDIDASLQHSEPYLGDFVEAREFKNLDKIRNETEQNLDDAWLQFEYDSDSSHISTTQDTNSLNVAVGIGASFHAGIHVFGLNANANFAKGTTNLQQAVNNANVKVAGELLRVTVKRPWFKPSIFQDSSLSFIQRDEDEQKNTYVSPGPNTERYLRDAIAGTTENLYLLPEYVTSLLLARNVNLHFSGLDANSVSQAIQTIAGGSFTGSYNVFSLSSAVGIKKTKQSVTADRTGNGMIINIPGAQIIGYYTTVMPQFPRSQNNL